MNRIYIMCLAVLLLSLPVQAQLELSEEAEISVLISSPYNAAVFTVFGHASFRVNDPVNKYDIVFNYGIFDFTSPNFIYRFAKGETDYKLDTMNYGGYVRHYIVQGSDVTELVLNLTEKEKNQLFNALVINARPENKVYRYNFFFDNCATRLPAMIERYTDSEVVYRYNPQAKTFRELVHDCTGRQTWLTFGIDLALGSPADRPATPHEMMFIPYYLQESLLQATIWTDGTHERPMVEKTNTIQALEIDDETPFLLRLFSPLVCGWLLFILVLAATIWGRKNKKNLLPIDILLFTIAGIAGIVLFFLSFVSEHPAIWPNWSVVWLHPFQLIGVLFFCVKKWGKAAYCYHFINFAALSLMLLGWCFIPQQMNAAFIPLILTLWLRSGSRIIRK